MKIRSITRWIAAAAIFLASCVPVSAESGQQIPELHTHAQAAALMDVTSGRLLYSSHGDDQLRIASLTKIMTAIVAIEHGDFNRPVKVSKNAFGKEGSSIYLKLGEEMTLENMLYGLMLRSGNDAATAIAEHVGGSEEGFVHLMNEKAQELGLQHSHFANPSGLDANGHYSSANDMAKLTAYALHNPLFHDIVKTQVKKAPNPNESWDYRWDNKNKMLRLYEGADGVKTGYTKKAFRCLVSSATRNGQQLVAVTLNDGDDWNDHAKMLDYGFKYFPLSQLMEKGESVQGYDLVVANTFKYPFADGEKERLEKKLVLFSPAREKAQDVNFGLRGEIRMVLDGKQIGTVPVYQKGSYLPEPNPRNPVKDALAPIHPSTLAGALSKVFKQLFLQQN
ncbi:MULTISPECIES: D-alanyl-D-alanine carboxypeptidase family protein [Paenibacillus]|uniref:D-alanyl-D-alanine carboxypeptidase n=1 Tax=Paenibacillus albilobatus TaxID=2716884 RepID=A0A919XH33_9BACL|nr:MULTISPECIES: D-alanyl-D-alanine carboxypeptidase family protein [Paenibacillus]MDR9853774.1 D-alanyl-D-alanine carboxypeptidase family protein [Paenibacillus sp. VCA1]GIO30825.1 D-alanyl-D-alanine carboxypeptidase [Paenibacillus albilobatus]